MPKIWVRVGGHFECQRSVLGQQSILQTQHPSCHCVATPNTKVKILDIFITTYLCLHIMIHMQKPYRIPCPTPSVKNSVSVCQTVCSMTLTNFPQNDPLLILISRYFALLVYQDLKQNIFCL